MNADVGVSPGTAITGFNPSCASAGAIHAGDTAAAQAHQDLLRAYADIDAVACDQDLTGKDLGGQTLAPDSYCFDTTAALTGALALDAGGDQNAVWIFQIGTALTTASNSSVTFAGGGHPCNVFWRAGSAATLGTDSAFQGNILAGSSITLNSGSNLVGRALAVNAAVTSDNNSVSAQNCL